MRVLTHQTQILCPHGFPVPLVPLGHPLVVGGPTPVLTAEEIEDSGRVFACPGSTAIPKCTTLSVVDGRAPHLTVTVGGRALTPVLETLTVFANGSLACTVKPAVAPLDVGSGRASGRGSGPAGGERAAEDARRDPAPGIILPAGATPERPRQTTEPEFFHELSARLATLLNPEVPVSEWVGPQFFEPFLRVGWEEARKLGLRSGALEPWLRERLNLGPAAVLEDFFAEALGLVGAHDLLSVIRPVPDAPDEVQWDEDPTDPAVVLGGAPLAGFFPPIQAERSLPSTPDIGRRVHKYVQNAYRWTPPHPFDTLVIERDVYRPGKPKAKLNEFMFKRRDPHLRLVWAALHRAAPSSSPDVIMDRGASLKPDILNRTSLEVYEIKPLRQAANAYRELHNDYLDALRKIGLTGYHAGQGWPMIPLFRVGKVFVYVHVPHRRMTGVGDPMLDGLVLYEVFDRVPERLRSRYPVPVPKPETDSKWVEDSKRVENRWAEPLWTGLVVVAIVFAVALFVFVCWKIAAALLAAAALLESIMATAALIMALLRDEAAPPRGDAPAGPLLP